MMEKIDVGALEVSICLFPFLREKEALPVGLSYAGSGYSSKQDFHMSQTTPNGSRCGKEKPKHRNVKIAPHVHS